MTDRFLVVKQHIETAYDRDDGFHLLASFVNQSVRGENDFLAIEERERIARVTTGYITNVPQLVAHEQHDGFTLSGRSDGAFDLTVNGFIPGSASPKYRIMQHRTHPGAGEAFLASPFVNRLLDIVIGEYRGV